MNCLAIDDEPLALDLLADNIARVPFLSLKGTCENVFEAGEILSKEKIDLIFLDIQMPGLNGLQFLRTLPEAPLVIFITAYKQYALEGYELDVVDYLLKPVSLERFVKACNKAKSIHDLRNAQEANVASPDYLFLNAGYSMQKVVFDQVTWIEGLRDYVQIHLKEAKPLTIRITLKALEELLPDRFMRVHKSYMVSWNAVSAVRRNSLLIDEQEIPIGESYQEAVRERLGNG